MKRNTKTPSKAVLDRMHKKAEIDVLQSEAFINYCEGFSKITPLLIWTARIVMLIVFGISIA